MTIYGGPWNGSWATVRIAGPGSWRASTQAGEDAERFLRAGDVVKVGLEVERDLRSGIAMARSGLGCWTGESRILAFASDGW